MIGRSSSESEAALSSSSSSENKFACSFSWARRRAYRVIHNSFTIRNENGGVSPSRPSRPFPSPCGTQRASPCIQIVLRVLSLLQGCHASSLRASASLNSAESFPWRAISKAAPMPDSVQPRSMVARSRANSSRASAQTRVHSGLSTSPYD